MSNITIQPDHDDAVKEMAWEISRNVVDHHKFVYPHIFKNAPSTFPVSLRNAIYNEISFAIKCHTDEEIYKWIARSKAHRKEMRRLKALQKRAQKARSNGDQAEIEAIMEDLTNEQGNAGRNMAF